MKPEHTDVCSVLAVKFTPALSARAAANVLEGGFWVFGTLSQHKFVPLGLMCPGGGRCVMNAPAPLKSVAVLSISSLFAGRFNPIMKSSFELLTR